MSLIEVFHLLDKLPSVLAGCHMTRVPMLISKDLLSFSKRSHSTAGYKIKAINK